jgi:hypothetical protein
VAEQKPTVGRIVHYKSFGTPGGEYAPKCRAAIVTDTDPDSEVISIAVLNPTGLFFDTAIAQDEDKKRGGTWHWPERDPA